MNKKRSILAVCVLSASLALVGCASVDKAVLQPQTISETVTNAAGQVKTTTYEGLAPSTNAVAVIETGSAIAKLLPPPAGTIVDNSIYIVAGLLALYARARNTRAKLEADKAETAEAVAAGRREQITQLETAVGSMVSAVEIHGSPAVKQAIATNTKATDTYQLVNDAVEKVDPTVLVAQK